jgi:hypothetical protein
MARRQTESHVWIEANLDLVAQYQPLCWADGQIIKSLGPFIERRAIERKTSCNRPLSSSTRWSEAVRRRSKSKRTPTIGLSRATIISRVTLTARVTPGGPFEAAASFPSSADPRCLNMSGIIGRSPPPLPGVSSDVRSRGKKRPAATPYHRVRIRLFVTPSGKCASATRLCRVCHDCCALACVWRANGPSRRRHATIHEGPKSLTLDTGGARREGWVHPA